MAKIKKFPNELPPKWGVCHCGGDSFRLKLSQDGVTVTNIVCAQCGDSEACQLGEDVDFEIDCLVDVDD